MQHDPTSLTTSRSAHALPTCAQYEALAPHNLCKSLSPLRIAHRVAELIKPSVRAALCAILLVVLVTICLFRFLPEEPERGARGEAQEPVKEVKKA